jgi:hypothetical protein
MQTSYGREETTQWHVHLLENQVGAISHLEAKGLWCISSKNDIKKI